MDRIAATFGPACWLPTWIQFLPLCARVHNEEHSIGGARVCKVGERIKAPWRALPIECVDSFLCIVGFAQKQPEPDSGPARSLQIYREARQTRPDKV